MSRETKSIVLIHGEWMSPRCWEYFREQYESRGFRVLAPAWPGMSVGGVEATYNVERLDELGACPFGGIELADVGLDEIVAHYELLVRALDERPILMGHGLGGLCVQRLLDRGLGAAGVVIGGTAPARIFRYPLSTLFSAACSTLLPWDDWRAVELTLKQFRQVFAASASDDEVLYEYDRYAAPCPARVIVQLACANVSFQSAGGIDFCNLERAPLLLVAGGDDRLAPPAAARKSLRLYADSTAITEFKDFSHRSHLMIVQPGWQDVADYVLCWAKTQVRRAAARDWHIRGSDTRTPSAL